MGEDEIMNAEQEVLMKMEDLIPALHTYLKDSLSSKSSSVTDEEIEELEEEAIDRLETKDFGEIESVVEKMVEEAEADLEEIVEEDKKEGKAPGKIIDDIDTEVFDSGNLIEHVIEDVTLNIMDSLEEDVKKVVEDVVKGTHGVDADGD